MLFLLVACAPSKDKYDPSTYCSDIEKADLLSGIVTYIFNAPPYTQMKDRFKPEHKPFYAANSARLFSLDRLYVNDNGRHYYLVVRPGSNATLRRAAGGFFDVSEDKSFKHFSEMFVTPQFSDSVARGRGRFLFDHMVKGDLDRFLKMESYVQWPNPISYYDSTTYEWKMDISRASEVDSLAMDTLRIN